jgi:hypothetical protein
MASSTAELSSLATSLGQLTERIETMANAAHESRDDGLATELYAIERALTGAHRRLDRLVTDGRASRR